MPKTKEDCFAFRPDNQYIKCSCLNKLYCSTEKCNFYKPKNEVKEIKYINY